MFKSKILGFIDYSTAILNLVLAFILYNFIHLFIKDILNILPIFIPLYTPIILFSILGVNKENFLSILIYILKYLLSAKLYLYTKSNG